MPATVIAREVPAGDAPPLAAVVVDLERARSRQWSDLLEAVAARRDTSAYERLFRHFSPRLRLRGITRGLAAATADDVVQETMLSVWQHAHQYNRRRGAASTWIYTIFRNKCIDAVRRQPAGEVDIDIVRDEVGDSSDTAEQIERRLAGVGLVRALAALTADQRRVVDKAFFEDKSHREVADELLLPLGTVKSRIRLGLTRMREDLGGGDPAAVRTAQPSLAAERDSHP